MNGHMSPEEFRRQGHAAIDWIADYWESLDGLPVRSQVVPGEVRDLMPASAPEEGESFDALLTDLDRVVVPGLTHWQHPRYFAYFPANSTPASILGDLLSSGIGAQGMIWATSPAVTEVEQVVLDWLVEALGLPAAFRSDGPGGGVIQDTASTATFTALLAALHRASGGSVRAEGVGMRPWAVYGSSQAHSSLVKAAMMAGLGSESVRAIDIDPVTQALDTGALRRGMELDIADGTTPLLVHVASGTTSTGAMDDIRAAATVAAEAGEQRPWVHVDAAWSGVAAVCPEHRHHLDGLELVDSFVTNPHKWLLTTFDCSTFWVRDRTALTGALSILPEYLRNAATQSGDVVDYRDWHPQLGRRFRALKLWAVLRTYGLSGLREHVRSGVDLAAHAAGLVGADERFELVTDPVLSLVVFRLRAGDEATMAAMEAVNDSGEAYFSHTTVNGVAAIRLAIGSWRTTRADVDRAWAALQSAVPA